MIVVEKFASFISECGKYSELMCMPSPFLYNCLQPLCILYYIVDHNIIILTILTYRSPELLGQFSQTYLLQLCQISCLLPIKSGDRIMVKPLFCSFLNSFCTIHLHLIFKCWHISQHLKAQTFAFNSNQVVLQDV